MEYVFVNLKRFDVPRELGGICPEKDPKIWVKKLVSETVELELGKHQGLILTYLLPEGLVIPAIDTLEQYDKDKVGNILIGCQGVYKDNVRPGENFGAFTTFKPAAAIKNLGSSWVIIGHSEERKFLNDVINEYESGCKKSGNREKASEVINRIINKEIFCALESKLNVLMCVGETEEERGQGSIDEQMKRVEDVLKAQLINGLKDLNELMGQCSVVIGYEPIWAIGPGKTPPNGEYIETVGRLIKKILRESFNLKLPVVYGGGLKKENAAEIASLESIDGGLVGLTKFTQPVAFETRGLKSIIDEYVSKCSNNT